MDRGTGKNREANPREGAGLLSIITFCYNYKVLKKGRKEELEDKDIYRTLPDFEAQKLGDRLESRWKEDVKTGAKLWTTLIKCYGPTYLMYTAIHFLFGTTVILYQPRALSKFVAYFQPNQTTVTTFDAYLYASATGGILILNALFLHNMAQLVAEYSLKVRTSLCSLIFRKALRISPVAFAEITIGKTLTLICKDVFAIDAALTFVKDMTVGFLQLGVVTYILYEEVGNTAFPPIVVIILIIPIQLICGKVTSKIRLKTAKKTDERFRLIQEMLSAIKVIKMYAWQNHFEKLIRRARLIETQKLTIVYYLKALIGWFGAYTLSLAFYVLLLMAVRQGHVLQAETVYFAQQCFSAIRMAITVSIPMGICNIADLVTALERIQSFLNADEISNPDPSPNSPPKVHLNKVKVAIKNHDVLNSVSLYIDGGLLLVTGNLGCGKSVLLKTIFGEYEIKAGYKEVRGTMSYAPEEPWIFPSTIRQNILFGAPYNHRRYQKVLSICALTYDISQLEKLDETIIGDKGLSLSRGQQARISLARAVYRESDIYLLDDCLSSLDNNVSDYIFSRCIKEFLKNKICIFVTNKIHTITQTTNNNILFLERGATLTLEQQNGSLDKRITYYIDEEINSHFRDTRKSFVNYSNECIMEETDDSDELLLAKDEDCIYRESKKSGSVSWVNYTAYLGMMGGTLVMIYLLAAFAAAQTAVSYSEKLISVWVNLEPQLTSYINKNQTNSSEFEEAVKSRHLYFKLYTIMIIVAMVITLVRSYSTFYSCLIAARSLHNRLVNAMLQASMDFFDGHYIGNIINRLSKDLYVIDEYMPFLIFDFLRMIFSFIGVIVLVASVNWLLLIPGLLLIIKLYFLQKLYLPTGRSLRRLEASCRSPIIGYLNSALAGISVVRATRQEALLQLEFDRHQDLYTSTYYMNQTTTRLFAFLIDIFGAIFTIGILLKLIIFTGDESAGDVGLAVTQAMTLSTIIQHMIRQTAELENAMTSVERVLEYTNAKRELKTGYAPCDWPVKGCIRFDNVSLSYRAKRVLKNISINIDGGSKIGIVGRTGAGKSSILSALFRLYDFEGTITIDDEDINSLPLDYLRSHITLIPQDSVLFSGTIRNNIDPLRKFTDDNIWKALEKVHLKHLVTDLDQQVKSSKISFSSGERQLICLARALIQNNTIIALDEATANLDPETSLVLQKTIQDCFKHCTVIIISHKLHSVLFCDEVLILKDGIVVETGQPEMLLRTKGSTLYKLIREENFETLVRLTHL